MTSGYQYQDSLKRAEKMLLAALLERDGLEKGMVEVKAGVKLDDSATEYAKRNAIKLAVDKLLENYNVDLSAGVEVSLDHDVAYLADVATARGWVRK